MSKLYGQQWWALTEGEVTRRVELGESYDSVSRHLQQLYSGRRGLCSRSIRRFCADWGIRPSSHMYGRSMQGLLRVEGIRVCQSRVGESLERTFPFQQRQNMHNLVNPVPYRAIFFGEKLHFDHNEKLAMYGMTHVLAVDGNSRKIVGFVTASKESNYYLQHPVPASFTTVWLVGSGAYGSRHWICAGNHSTIVSCSLEGSSVSASRTSKYVTTESAGWETVAWSQPPDQLSSKWHTDYNGRSRRDWHE